MAEHQPCFVQNNEARRAIETLLDAAEEIGQHRNQAALAHVHQLLDFEALEPAKR